MLSDSWKSVSFFLAIDDPPNDNLNPNWLEPSSKKWWLRGNSLWHFVCQVPLIESLLSIHYWSISFFCLRYYWAKKRTVNVVINNWLKCIKTSFF